MEQTEQQARHSSGIQNFYYSGVINVINLKLTEEQLKAVAAETSIFNGTVGQIIERVNQIK